jgi:hypothetical protein
MFNELYNVQRAFSVPDPELRSQLRSDNVDLVVRKYAAFLNMFVRVCVHSSSGRLGGG